MDEVTDNKDGTYTVELKGYEFIIKDSNLEIIKINKSGGIIPEIEINLYQTDGQPYEKGKKYDEMILTINISNKADLDQIDKITLLDEEGKEYTPEITVIGNEQAEASYKIKKEGIYMAKVLATTAGIPKEGQASLKVNFIPLFEDVVKPGEYVQYPHKNSNYTFAALYVGHPQYGNQLVFPKSTTPEVTLCKGSEWELIEGYNDAIKTLNEAARWWINENYAKDARSIGTRPDDPDYDSSMMNRNEQWFAGFNNKIREANEDYLMDIQTLRELNLQSGGTDGYWIAARTNEYRTGGFHDTMSLYVRSATYQGVVGQTIWFSLSEYDPSKIGENLKGLSSRIKPCIILKEGIKIVGGSGTDSDPWKISI